MDDRTRNTIEDSVRDTANLFGVDGYGRFAPSRSNMEIEKMESDYKEAFFTLAVLVNGGEFDEAKKYVASFLRRPTWRAVDVATPCAECGQSANWHLSGCKFEFQNRHATNA